MKFKCLHSGKCCKTPLAQINLTLGDIQRIHNHTKIPIRDLFKDYIGLNPFKEPKSNKFDIELGMNKPCQFRTNRCEIYKARPLNCRLFPLWILADMPGKKIKQLIPEEYECIHRLKITKQMREKFKQYAEQVGDILLKESKITDQFMIKNNLRFSVEVTNPDKGDIEFIKSMIKESNNPKLAEKIQKEINNHKFKTIEEINKFEELL